MSFTRLLAMTLLLAATPRVADACSCWKRGPAESCEMSDAVFEGRVVRVIRDKPKGYLTATFAVTRRWKGALQAQVDVMTELDSSMCGLSFDKAEEWMIYARSGANGLSAGLCSRSRRTPAAAEDRAALGPGLPPVRAGQPPPSDGATASTCDSPRIQRPRTPGDSPIVKTKVIRDAPPAQPTQAAAAPPPTAQPGGCRVTPPGGSLLLGSLLLVLRRRRR